MSTATFTPHRTYVLRLRNPEGSYYSDEEVSLNLEAGVSVRDDELRELLGCDFRSSLLDTVTLEPVADELGEEIAEAQERAIATVRELSAEAEARGEHPAALRTAVERIHGEDVVKAIIRAGRVTIWNALVEEGELSAYGPDHLIAHEPEELPGEKADRIERELAEARRKVAELERELEAADADVAAVADEALVSTQERAAGEEVIETLETHAEEIPHGPDEEIPADLRDEEIRAKAQAAPDRLRALAEVHRERGSFEKALDLEGRAEEIEASIDSGRILPGLGYRIAYRALELAGEEADDDPDGYSPDELVDVALHYVPQAIEEEERGELGSSWDPLAPEIPEELEDRIDDVLRSDALAKVLS